VATGENKHFYVGRLPWAEAAPRPEAPQGKKQEAPKKRKPTALATLRKELALVQAACAMATEGVTRATAGQVVERTEVPCSASEAGQFFARIGVRTATAHGRARLVLDAGQLQPWAQTLAAEFEELAPRVEAWLAQHQEVGQRVAELHRREGETLKLLAEEARLRESPGRDQQPGARLTSLRYRVEGLRRQVAEVPRLEREVQDLSAQAQRLPDLERKREDLASRLEALRQAEAQAARDEAALTVKEQALARRLERLRQRGSWTTMAELDQAIEQARRELEDVSRQLGEKRSLVGRFLGRKDGSVP